MKVQKPNLKILIFQKISSASIPEYSEQRLTDAIVGIGQFIFAAPIVEDNKLNESKINPHGNEIELNE